MNQESQSRAHEELPRRRLNGEATPEELEASLEQTRVEMSETLHAIEQKLSPSEIVDQIFRYYHTGPGEFAQNLGESVKRNPLPVTLITIGLGWLMMADRQQRHYGYGGYTSEGLPYGEEGRGVRVAGEGRERLGEAREKISEKSHRVSEAIGETRQRMGERAHEMREKMSETMSGMRERVGESGSRMREQAGRVSSSVRSGGRYASDTVSYLAKEQPLLLGAFGLAVGALLGAAMPRTRREDELMGETREEFMGRAKEAGKEEMHKVQHTAAAAARAAKEEAEKQDWTPESMKQESKSGVIGTPVTESTKSAMEKEKEHPRNK